ncbi:hypothetical protein BESB_067520 [Besnoitia besnoiti]|uniref:Ribosomal RNA-processing protein 43 n=1 Tax=Besnoitia besnoiti TaxID=94643 RepID=A0A2A9M9Z1_BESBE|nr:hypothetical protein BESB_067520 [Besnoitia besnoiti]PFH34719.1 hypothetical protein BESB_067520 [Besnoitia besnoiti]
MDCEAFRAVLPAEFQRRFLIKRVRADGRSFLTYRQPRICSNTLANCCGSASVRAGNNYYLAGVRCEVGRAAARECSGGIRHSLKSFISGELGNDSLESGERCNVAPTGRIVATVEFPKICGAEFTDAGGPAVNAPLLISGAITDVLNSSFVFDSSQLRLRGADTRERGSRDDDGITDEENGAHSSSENEHTEAQLGREFAWHLNVHIVCLEYDGNPLDFALLAAVAALENTVLPGVCWDRTAKWWKQLPPEGNTSSATITETSGSLVTFGARKLFLSSRPISVTFSNVMSQWWVVDPSREEENLGTWLSMVFMKNKWHVLRLGGTPVGASVIKMLQVKAGAIASGADAALSEAVQNNFH